MPAEISFTEGAEDVLLSDMLSQIAQNTVFTKDDEIIASDEAIADVKLYYMNNDTKTEITQEVLQELQAGKYTVTAEYHGTEFAGENIILTVTAPVSGHVITINNIELEQADNAEWDWAACARMVANSRCDREGLGESSVSQEDVVVEIYSGMSAYADYNPDDLLMVLERVNRVKAAKAAVFVYGTDNSYKAKTVLMDEEVFASTLGEGKVVIMLLTSISEQNNMEKARYVILTGIDTANHKYQIFDPIDEHMDRKWFDI